jgi:RNA polymerase sigma factor (sigma-70 family)
MVPDIDQQVLTIMETQRPALERYIRSLTRDEDEAADLCQEVWMRLLVTARSQGLPTTPGAWSKRVAYNLFVSSARRRQTAVRRADQLVDRRVAPAVDEVLIGRERDAVVRSLLDANSPADREAMVMAASGFDTRSIAARLGRSEVATRTLLCRARGRMRMQLAAADA